MLEKSPQKILSIVGVGTALSLVYSAVNYATQIGIVELFGYGLRGVYEVLMSVLSLASVLFSFNFYTAINLHVSKNTGAPANLRALGNAVLGVQLLALFVMLFFVPAQDVLAGKWPLFLALLLAAAVLNHKVNELTAILNGRHYFIEARKLVLVGAIATALAIGLVFLLGARSAGSVVWIAVIGPFLAGYAYARWLFSKHEDLRQRSGMLGWRTLCRENGAVYAISLAQLISSKLFLLYLARQVSVELLGVFSLSSSLIQFVLLPPTLLATIIISSPNGSLSRFTRPFLALIAYGICACLAMVVFIELGFMHWLGLKSMRNPLFVGMLEVMALSIPCSVLNILVVATAIRKGMCSRMVVFGQALMVPLPLLFYHLAGTAWGATAAIGGAYVATWCVASLFTLGALYNNLRKSRGMAWPAFP
jgi:hypothetical protein